MRDVEKNRGEGKKGKVYKCEIFRLDMVQKRVLIITKLLKNFRILRKKGVSFRKIAKIHGTTHSRIIRYFKGYTPKNKFWTKEDIEILKREYPQGDLKKLQKQLKCSRKSIQHQVGKHNFQRDIKGKRNPNWKGDNVGCSALHQWVKVYKQKPKFCEICKIKHPYDLANISGEYKRDINDFEWLCRSCHMKKDERIFNLKPFQNYKENEEKRKTKRSI